MSPAAVPAALTVTVALLDPSPPRAAAAPFSAASEKELGVTVSLSGVGAVIAGVLSVTEERSVITSPLTVVVEPTGANPAFTTIHISLPSPSMSLVIS